MMEAVSAATNELYCQLIIIIIIIIILWRHSPHRPTVSLQPISRNSSPLLVSSVLFAFSRNEESLLMLPSHLSRGFPTGHLR